MISVCNHLEGLFMSIRACSISKPRQTKCAIGGNRTCKLSSLSHQLTSSSGGNSAENSRMPTTSGRLI
eukprot:1075220-Prorocentrum_minimum.AAC.4